MNSSDSQSWPNTAIFFSQLVSTVLLVALALSACGGGSSNSVPVDPNPVPTGPNVAPLIVDAGPTQLLINLPSVSVKVCAPGTTRCVTVDHILVDTASIGLRLFASKLPASVVLPAAVNSSGVPIFECQGFADGYTWGSVRKADVQLADGVGSNIAVHILDNAIANAPVPRECVDPFPGVVPPRQSINDPASFRMNGVLGVQFFKEDCLSCATTPVPAAYYDCGTSPCVPMAAALNEQVQNPVAQFAANNNGVAIQLPQINAAGQTTVNGYLILGIDTQTNNQLGSAAVIKVDPITGYFTTNYKNATLSQSYIDSGSGVFYFDDPALPVCTVSAQFYCPASATSLSATIEGTNGVSSLISFGVVNADSVLGANPGFTAYKNIAGPVTIAPGTASSTFDWGLPFFFGRRVYFAFERQSTSAGPGPFVAY